MAWLAIHRDEVLYYVGLALLFAGICLRVSVATALMVVGGILAAESVVTSYVALWIGARKS